MIDKHARAAFFSYSRAPLPLQRIGQHLNGEGDPIELQEHNLREGFRSIRVDSLPQVRAGYGIGCGQY